MEVLTIIIYLGFISFLITGAFALLFRSRGPWGSYWSAFLMIFLFVWIVSIWTRPVGPVYYGLSLVPILFTGILIAILLTAVTPPHLRTRKGLLLKTDKEEAKSNASVAAGIFFWVAIVILIVAIIVGYATQ